jgi:hypothetical protein
MNELIAVLLSVIKDFEEMDAAYDRDFEDEQLELGFVRMAANIEDAKRVIEEQRAIIAEEKVVI